VAVVVELMARCHVQHLAGILDQLQRNKASATMGSAVHE